MQGCKARNEALRPKKAARVMPLLIQLQSSGCGGNSNVQSPHPRDRPTAMFSKNDRYYFHDTPVLKQQRAELILRCKQRSPLAASPPTTMNTCAQACQATDGPGNQTSTPRDQCTDGLNLVTLPMGKYDTRRDTAAALRGF